MRSSFVSGLALAGLLACGLQAQVVNERQARQQSRIENGVATGELTPGETRHVERKERRIHREVRRDRRENGGVLTPGERAKVNRQENRVSRDIARDKHNDRVQ